MSANHTPNDIAREDGVTPSQGQGPGERVLKSQKARHRKAVKKTVATNVTKPRDIDAGQKQMEPAGSRLKPTQKSPHGNLRVSSEPLNAEADTAKVVPLSSETSSLAQTLSHSEAASSSQGSYSDTAESHGPSRPEDSSTASPSPVASAVVVQPVENLLEMIRQQRQALLTGPQISICIGNTSVTGIYKRAAMAASPFLQRHFSKHPKSLEYHFAKSTVDPSTVHFLLVEWMHETCNEFEASAIPAQKSFEADIAVLRVAHMLRIERYCAHTLAEYVNYLKKCLPSYEEIAIIEKNFPGDRNKLWKTMVRNLSYQRFKGYIPDPKEFEDFLGEHPRLKRAMKATDEAFVRKAKERADHREEPNCQRQEKHQAEQHEREAHEKLTSAELKNKIGALVL